jgi:DNA-binding CsgD family transcriptional regulator
MQYAYDTARLFAKTAFAKLGARNQTHAVALALRAGLIT